MKYYIEKGQKFHMLTVVSEFRDNTIKKRMAECICDCGTKTISPIASLFTGSKKSCGCFGKHGLYKHPLNHIWVNIRNRCKNKNQQSYKDYGGRGIYVCKEWDDFKSFYQWAILNGWQKGLQIDRKNNDGPYSPDNCRVVTAKVNSNNRRDTIIVNFNGSNIPFRLACEQVNVKPKLVWQTMKRKGWSFPIAVNHHKSIQHV